MIWLELLGNIIKGIALLYWLLGLALLYCAIRFPRTKTRAAIWSLIVIAAFAYLPVKTGIEHERKRAAFAATKAEFERRCKDAIRIYKVVEDVEGIQLLKIRHKVQSNDLMAPGAAFAKELKDDEYIDSFLQYEATSHLTPAEFADGYRRTAGSTSQRIGKDGVADQPGYRFVDIYDELDGKRYRVTGSMKITGRMDTEHENVKRLLAANPGMDLNIYQWRLDKQLTTDSAPRYAVTFEDHVIPEERSRGLASSTVQVIDTESGEVLGEMQRTALSGGKPTPANPYPWSTSYACPGSPYAASVATRLFVDQVLIPKGAVRRNIYPAQAAASGTAKPSQVGRVNEMTRAHKPSEPE